MKPTDFAIHLTTYLSSFLPGQRGISANTIKSYGDTFVYDKLKVPQIIIENSPRGNI